MIKKVYKKLSTAEKNGKKIGLFRTLCSIFGGLIIAYLGMTFLAFILPGKTEESAIIAIMFNTLIWVIVSIYIILSPTRLIALLRFSIPTFVFIILNYIYY